MEDRVWTARPPRPAGGWICLAGVSAGVGVRPSDIDASNHPALRRQAGGGSLKTVSAVGWLHGQNRLLASSTRGAREREGLLRFCHNRHCDKIGTTELLGARARKTDLWVSPQGDAHGRGQVNFVTIPGLAENS